MIWAMDCMTNLYATHEGGDGGDWSPIQDQIWNYFVIY